MLKNNVSIGLEKKDFNQCRKCRNMYNSLIKNAKKNYFNNAIKQMSILLHYGET